MVSVSAWKNSDFPEGDDTVKAKTEQTKEFYFDRPITDCQADLFQIRSEREICWGGYVVIGISVAVVVIIAIIIGVSINRSYTTVIYTYLSPLM